MRKLDLADLRSPTLAIAVASVGLAALQDSVASGLALDRDAFAGEPWRLWSCHLVHYSWRHALFDAGAVLILGNVAESSFGRKLVATVLLLTAPLLSIGLMWWVPSMAEYRGASGLAALLGTMAVAALWRSQPQRRVVLMCASMLFVAKSVCAAMHRDSVIPLGLSQGVLVVWQAHALAIGAAALVLIFVGPAAAAFRLMCAQLRLCRSVDGTTVMATSSKHASR